MDIETLLEMNGYAEDGWATDGYGMSSIFICPHGNRIEQDGKSDNCGCVSPLVEMGAI